MADTTSESYLVVIEKSAGNLSAFSPDLPGCVVTGASRAEVEAPHGRGHPNAPGWISRRWTALS